MWQMTDDIANTPGPGVLPLADCSRSQIPPTELNAPTAHSSSLVIIIVTIVQVNTILFFSIIIVIIIIIVCFGIFFSISKQESLFYEIADRLFITVIIVIITVFMSLFDKDKW